MSLVGRYLSVGAVLLLLAGSAIYIYRDSDPDSQESQAGRPNISEPDSSRSDQRWTADSERVADTVEADAIQIHQLELKRSSGVPALEGVTFRFYGNSQLTDEEILDGFKIPRSPYFSDLENVVRRHVNDTYGEHGFAQARVTALSAEGDNPTVVTVEINEGGIHYFNELTLKGIGRYPEDEIASFYPEKGELVNRARLHLADARVRDKYVRDGYLDAKVSTNSQSSDLKQSLDYQVSVSEGKQYRVGRVSLPGEVQEGFPFSNGKVFRPDVLRQFLRARGVPQDQVQVDRDPDRAIVEIIYIG